MSTSSSERARIQAARAGLLEPVEELLRLRGYASDTSRSLAHVMAASRPTFAPQFPAGPDIFGVEVDASFLLYHPKVCEEPIFVECWWQPETGTEDEVFPYLFANMTLRSLDTVMVLDGGGYRAGAKGWLQQRVGRSRLQAVVALRGFEEWMDAFTP